MMKKVVICLRLGSIFTLLIGMYLLYLAITDKEVNKFALIFLFLVSVVLVVWYEITIIELKKLKSWAWKSAIIIFGLFIPTAFIIMGIVGMQSVLSNTMREKIFGKKENIVQVNAKSFADIINSEKHIKNDESIEEYIQNNDALQRYMSYKRNSNDTES